MIVGQDEAIVQARAYMDGQAMTPAALLIGASGIGKTMVAHQIAEEYDLEPYSLSFLMAQDISLEISKIHSPDLNGQKKLLIIEDVEGATYEQLNPLLDIQCPKMITVHLLEDIHWRIHSLCQHVVFRQPTTEDFLEYFRINDWFVPPNDALSKFRNYTDVNHWFQKSNRTSEILRSELEEVREIFNRGASEGRIKFQRLMDFYLYNGGNPKLATELDLMVHNNQEREAMAILLQQNLRIKCNVPFYYRVRSKYRYGVYIRVLGFED